MKKILIVDGAEDSANGVAWRTGAKLFAGSFDAVHLVESPSEFLRVLANYAPKSIDELQFWGHGRPGQMLVDGDPVDPDSKVAWSSVHGGVIWIRTCDTLRGEQGHNFTSRLAAASGADIVGHLGVIGNLGLHSFLVGMRAKDRPWWPASYSGGKSGIGKPRTITALQMSLPSWTFTKDGLR